MGTLAKHGIANGCRVELAVLVPEFANPKLSVLARKYFAKLGLARIAERVIERRPLSVADINLLLNKAPFAALLKLVELRCGAESCLQPKPLTHLPIKRWLSQHSPDKVLALTEKHLNQYQHPDLRVAIDLQEIVNYEPTVREDFLSVIQETVARNPGVTFVGQNGEILELSELSQKPSLASVRNSSSSSQVISTNILQFATSQDLAKELFRIHELSVEEGVDLWIPCYEAIAGKGRCVPPAIKDFQLLKLMALGSIALINVKYRRASTQYFSVAALSIARLCGANDLGFGAVDKPTAKVLQIGELKALQTIASNTQALNYDLDKVGTSKSIIDA